MDKSTFNEFRKLVYERSGICLGEQKETLVCARVGKRMRLLGIQSYRAYLRHVMDDESGEEVVHLLNAISTNVTSFFREPAHFEFLSKAFSQWLAEGQKRFRFWSAACSTGEEPYSLAVTLMEALGGASIDIKILATDISTRALERCLEGVYHKDRLKDVPAVVRDRHFEYHRDSEGVFYSVKPSLKRMVVFKRLNLSTSPFPMHGPFDAIFCRNVMIYFDNRIRQELLAEMHRLLKPGGYLMVGHAESLAGIACSFKGVKPSIYAK
ncbi:protein-glutamate O-methyltransferase [Candidatus Poribacteria bacterium]|nr:protein-glutamate O-methyltransferase [Candidatus Poribacteria bacterium]